jgi:lysophospholipase L1-like esterase
MIKITLQIMFCLLILSTEMFAGEKTIVMLGDSTTLCARNATDKKITTLVQNGLALKLKKANTEFKVINSGVGGSTAKDAVARLQTSVIAHKPDIVTISFGLNDTGNSTPEEFKKSLETMIETIKKDSTAQILLITSTPFDNNTHAWKDKFAKEGGVDAVLNTKFCSEMRNLAVKHKIKICDLHQKFEAEIKKDPSLIKKVLLPDGVHLTDEGNVLAAGFIVEEISKMVQGKK